MKQQLIDQIEQFLRLIGQSATWFGKSVMNDGHFLSDLKYKDRNPTIATFEKCQAFMQTYGKEIA